MGAFQWPGQEQGRCVWAGVTPLWRTPGRLVKVDGVSVDMPADFPAPSWKELYWGWRMLPCLHIWWFGTVGEWKGESWRAAVVTLP